MKYTKWIPGIFSLIFALLLISDPLQISAAGAETAGGSCGDNVSWTLFDDGLLEITGTGPMNDFKSGSIPWKNYKSQILAVRVGEGVDHIGSWAFYGCKYAAGITLPAGLRSIGDNAFVNCSGLESLELPDGLLTLGKNVFGGCTSLKSLTLPNSLLSIGSHLFKECTALTAITIPEGITELKGNTFYGCKALETIALPASLVKIGLMEFEGCARLKSIRVDGESCVFSSDGSGVLYDFGKTTLLACPAAYAGAYEIPGTVTQIGPNAFMDCRGLTAVTIPDSVQTIGSAAFWGCDALTSINIPDGITAIPDEMLALCAALPEVTLPQSIEVIGIGAFMGCESLTELVLPDSVHAIGSTAFGECYDLTEMVIPDGVTSIEMQLFRDCQSMVSVTIPDSVQQIGDTAFLHCHSLKHVTIPDGVTEIPYGAFMRCYGLESVDLPDSVTAIGINAFYECDDLQRIEVPAGVTRIEDYTFYRCYSLEEVILPDGITEIDQYAFYGCHGLPSVDLPEALAVIGKYAFGYTAMTEVVLPAAVTEIGDYAFINDYIRIIRFLGSAPSFGAYSLGGLTADAYYPIGGISWTPEVMLDYGGDITWCGYAGQRVYRAEFTQATISLDGDIGLHYYARLSEDLAGAEDAYLEFTVAGITRAVPVAMAKRCDDGSYRFSCPIPAKAMTDPVTAQIYTSQGPVGTPKTYSVKQYCGRLMEYVEENGMTGYECLLDLVKALLNYGAYSQAALHYRTDDLANADLSTAEKMLPETVDASAWAHRISGSEDGIEVVSASLLLETTTTIRIFYRLTGEKEIGDYIFLVDGVPVEPVASGGLYYIDAAKVVARDLDRMYTIDVGGLSVRYCGLSYVNQIMNWPEGPETVKDAAKALYVYAMAANAYFGG